MAVLLLPLATLVVMWGLATWVTVPPGLALLDAQISVDAVGRPLQELITQLQAERKLALSQLAAPAGQSLPEELSAQRTATDLAVAELRTRTSAEDARSALTETGSARLTDLLLHLDALPALRTEVDQAMVDGAAALRRYTQAIDAGLSLSRSLIRLTDGDLLREAQALMSLSEARELLAREDAVVTAALARGEFAEADLSQAVILIGAQRHQFAAARADLHVDDRIAYERLAADEAAGTILALEDRLILEGRSGAAPPLDGVDWSAAYDRLTSDLRVLELDAAQRLVERSRPEAVFILSRIVVAGVLGLLAMVLTAIASVRVARSLLRQLAGLRQAALELSIDRLPRVVERLRRGEHVDVATEAPPLPYGTDEIGQVGHAFNALQRTAVQAAVAEADLRRGVNEVFLNIARRSQTLLHRQLSILDTMERRAEDPKELEDLFRVDHLATRMRRNAEYLVILAGAAPGRGWRLPVPLVDVLRGAVSEVEDYARVSVQPVPEVALAGPAVGDVIHLLAELIENATTFSPPTARVEIRTEPVTNGLAVEVEDRGIGILPPILAELNARLADEPDFAKVAADADSGAGGQLGLFVVARLAARHAIQVQLRRSAYGGTTAVVLLPAALLAVITDPAQLPAGPSSADDLVQLTSASPHAPRSSVTSGFTPVPGHGNPLPSRRGERAAQGADGVGEAETAVIVATTGKALGRHTRREVIDAEDPDDLPKRVRQRRAGHAAPDDLATQAEDARSPEQIRAMMSSFQAGTDRGRMVAEYGDDGGSADRTGDASGRGTGTASGGDETVEAT